MSRDPRVGWGVYYRGIGHHDRYFEHNYHYFYHGISLCNRVINRMPDQKLFETLPEPYTNTFFCAFCAERLMQKWVPPKYLWRDDVYETYRGARYETWDGNYGPNGIVEDMGQYDPPKIHLTEPKEQKSIDVDLVAEIATIRNRVNRLSSAIEDLQRSVKKIQTRMKEKGL